MVYTYMMNSTGQIIYDVILSMMNSTGPIIYDVIISMMNSTSPWMYDSKERTMSKSCSLYSTLWDPACLLEHWVAVKIYNTDIRI